MLTPTSGERRSTTEAGGILSVSPGRPATSTSRPARGRSAVLATTGRLCRASKRDPAGVQAPVGALPAVPRGRAGAVLAPAQVRAGPVGRAVVPGRLDQQPAGVPVAGLGDRRPGEREAPEEDSVGTSPR